MYKMKRVKRKQRRRVLLLRCIFKFEKKMKNLGDWANDRSELKLRRKNFKIEYKDVAPMVHLMLAYFAGKGQ